MPTNVNQKVRVELSPQLRGEFESVAKSAAQAKARRARILLLADEAHPDGQRPDRYIAERVGVSERQVARIRQQFVGEGRDALERKERPDLRAPKKIDAKAEATLIMLACSKPPAGRDHWTLQLLCDAMARLKVVEKVTPEAVRRRLKKTGCSLGAKNASASPRRTAPASSPRWSRSSTSIRKRSTTTTR
jgi:transposase